MSAFIWYGLSVALLLWPTLAAHIAFFRTRQVVWCVIAMMGTFFIAMTWFIYGNDLLVATVLNIAIFVGLSAYIIDTYLDAPGFSNGWRIMFGQGPDKVVDPDRPTYETTNKAALKVKRYADTNQHIVPIAIYPLWVVILGDGVILMGLYLYSLA